MKIVIIIEGDTESVFLVYLREFLKNRLQGKMPNIRTSKHNGRIPAGEKLKRVVNNLLADNINPADHVIALTDVYTGSNPPDFKDAQDAKNKMREWVGNEPRFHPHAAQFDFEAWLLPYWPTIQRIAGYNKTAPPGNPESVNHNNPPAHRVKEIFEIGNKRSYVKPRDASRVLRENDLSVAINKCPELKAFINTILTLSDGEEIP